MWNLWLDDQCEDNDCPDRLTPDGFFGAKSSEEAIALTKEMGAPGFIDFDHDLGGDDNAMIYLKWLVQNYYNINVPPYNIHSANPIGSKNIEAYMESWKKSKEL